MNKTLSSLTAALLLSACMPEDTGSKNNNPGNDDTELSGELTSDRTLETGKTYTLSGDVFVKSGTLTIQPGVRIVSSGGALIVTSGGKLNAVGTAEAPIVFTSSRPVGERAAGDWKGLVLLGKAPINVTGGSQTIEGFAAGSNDLANYGGQDATHDCGVLKYARVEFTGFKLANGNELQGLTIGGCGSATTIDYVQSHVSLDDGIEVFGGTSDMKHLVITGADDDGLDWDFGYAGRVQFVVVQQHPDKGNWGIEADSNEKSFEALPRSSPELWNITLVGRPSGGAEKSGAMMLRRGTAGKLHNVIAVDFADGAIDIADASTAAQWNGGALAIKNSIFYALKGNTTGLVPTPNPVKDSSGTVTEADGANFNEASKLMEAVHANKYVNPQLVAATNITAPNFLPATGSPALDANNAGVPGTGFDGSARFVGAFGTTDWSAGWTAYPEN